MASKSTCPCGSSAPYAACCRPLHRGEREAPTAEALMRSRYAAFVQKEWAYLWRTLHPGHADRAAGEAELTRQLRGGASRLRYMGLFVLDRREAPTSELAEVLFLARVFEKGIDRSFVELSEFAHDGVGWRYLAGRLVPTSRISGDPMTLRIDAFPR